MKVGDKIKIKIDYGYLKAGHEGVIARIGFESHRDKIFDYGVLLDGDAFYEGFNENELERRDEG